MTDNTTKIFIGIIAVMQIVTAHTVNHRDQEAQKAVFKAAAAGMTTLRVNGKSYTMLNGHRSADNPNHCFVNIAETDTGEFLSDWSGWYFDLWSSPRKFEIDDCRKLPKRVFLSYTNE